MPFLHVYIMFLYHSATFFENNLLTKYQSILIFYCFVFQTIRSSGVELTSHRRLDTELRTGSHA